MSRIERGQRNPGLRLAISLEVLTGMPLHEILTSLYETVEEETLARATTMLIALEHGTSMAAQAKCRHLWPPERTWSKLAGLKVLTGLERCDGSRTDPLGVD